VKFNGGGSGASLSGLVLRNISGNGIEFSAANRRYAAPAWQRQISSRMTSGITIEGGGVWENIGGSAIALSGIISRVEIVSPKIANTNGNAISITNSSGDITISGAEISGTANGSGIFVSNSAGRINIERAILNGIKGKGIDLSSVNSFIKIDSPRITNSGDHAISIVNSSGDIDISGANIKDITNASGIYISGGSGRRDIVDSTLDKINGTGILINSPGSAGLNIQRPTIRNSGAGISISGSSGTVQINGADFSNIMGTGISVSSTGRVEILNSRMMTGSVAISGTSGHRDIIGLRTDRDVTVRGGSSLTMSDVEITDSTEYGIYITDIDGLVSISESRITGGWIDIRGGRGEKKLSGITLNNMIDDAIYINARESSSITLERITMRDARGSAMQGADIYGGSKVTAKDIVIENASGISLHGTTVTVSGIKASGVKGYVLGLTGTTVQVSNSSVTNADSGFSLHGSESVTVDNVTVNGASTTGISIGSGFDTTSPVITLSNSTIENTGRALEIRSGNFTVGGVKFINNLSTNLNTYSEEGRIFHTWGKASGRFQNCEFRHEDWMERKELPGKDFQYISLFHLGNTRVEFNNCDFVNLRGVSSPHDTYYFSRWVKYVEGGQGTVAEKNDIILRGSNFTFRNGERVGLMAGYAGSIEGIGNRAPDNLLVDGITITNNGSTQPLFWFHGNSSADTFKFRKNTSFYNGEVINDSLIYLSQFLPIPVVRFTSGGSIKMID